MAKRLRRGNTPNSYPLVTQNGVRYFRELLEGWKPARNTDRIAVMFGSVVRFKTASGDHGDESEMTSLNERTELLTADFRTSQFAQYAQFGEDFWLSFGFMVAPGDRHTADFNIVGQMHGVQGSLGINRQPPFVFALGPQSDQQYADGIVNLTAQTRYSDPVPNTGTNIPSTTRWGANLVRGRFYQIVCRMRFSLTGGGQLEIWLDGVPQNTGAQNFNFGYNEPGADGAGYYQFGHYRHFAPETCVTYVANMEQGKSSLASRIASPLVIPPQALRLYDGPQSNAGRMSFNLSTPGNPLAMVTV